MTASGEPPTIFLTNDVHPDAMALLSKAGRCVLASATTRQSILEEATSADVIIVRAPLPPELFDAAPRLRGAIRHGAGLDMIPMAEATRAGVLVANVPAVNAATVAEHVIFCAIGLLRHFRQVDKDLRTAGWFAGRAHADRAHDLSGRKLGIVGMGSVGRSVHRIANGGFGLEVLAHTRSPDALPSSVAHRSIDDLVAESDVLVLCCPLTAETTGLISSKRIARMKPSAILINVSRGPVVDETALTEALASGRIAGAALDVFADQPLDPASPLLGLDNVILTPHLAGITEESMGRMGEGAAAEALRILRGDLPQNLRNPEAVALYRTRFPQT